MRERLIQYLRERHDVTPASAAKSLGFDRRRVQSELSILVGLGQVASSVNSLGVTSYKLVGEPVEAVVESKPKTQSRKPFSPNRTLGAFMKDGNLVIKLSRRNNAKSLTLSQKDFDMLSTLFRSGNDQ